MVVVVVAASVALTFESLDGEENLARERPQSVDCGR